MYARHAEATSTKKPSYKGIAMFRIFKLVVVAMFLFPATYIMALGFERFAESIKREATLFPSNAVECLWA